jgi:hypothetical protein
VYGVPGFETSDDLEDIAFERIDEDEAISIALSGFNTREPLGEQIVMWWNFIGRSHEEIIEFRRTWQSEVISDGDESGRFGRVRGYDGAPLPAPELPNVRLRPRG